METHCDIPIELAMIDQTEWKRRETEIRDSRHVEGEEKFEASARVFSSLVRVRDLTWLPGVGSNVEGESVDAVVVGEHNVLQPGVCGVRVGITDHMVGSHELVIAISLRSCGETSLRRSQQMGGVEVCRRDFEHARLPCDRGTGFASAKRAITRAKRRDAIIVFRVLKSLTA